MVVDASPRGGGEQNDARRLEIAEAAERCFERWGVQRTRMEDVAREAGLARPVLYRYFANKRALQTAVMVRHIDRRAGELHDAVPAVGHVAPLLLRALVSGIAEPPGDHVSESVLGVDVIRETAQLVAESDEIALAMHRYWQPYLALALEAGELRDAVTIEAAERWLTRTVFTFLALPELTPPAQELEALLATFVVAAVVS
jgi:AcrR family transcriptional regulator